MGLKFVVKREPTPSAPGGLKDSSNNDNIFSMDYGEGPPTWNALSQFGQSCVTFTGNDQYIDSPGSNSDFNLGTIFTIDCWIRWSPLYTYSLSQTTDGAWIVSNWDKIAAGESFTYQGYQLGLTKNGELRGQYGDNANQTLIETTDQADIILNGGWHHLAFQRNGSGLHLYVDGIHVESGSTAVGSHPTVTNPFTVGRSSLGNQDYFLFGSIDEVEVINGVNRWSTGGESLDFTPPTAPSTATANHIVLMHFDDDDSSELWNDTVWRPSAQYWYHGGGVSWNGSQLTGFASGWTAQYGWQNKFRPEKMRITGTVAGGGTVNLVTDEFHDPQYSIVGTGAAVSVLTMDLTYDSEDLVDDDFKYLQGMTAFSAIQKVEFDSKPIEPSAA